MLCVDNFNHIKDNSALLDNTTLIYCHPLRSEETSASWSGEMWAKRFIDWGMSNLVESLILYDNIYVDNVSKYENPIIDQIGSQFDGLIRGINIGEFRENIIKDAISFINKDPNLAKALYLIAESKSDEPKFQKMLHSEAFHNHFIRNLDSKSIGEIEIIREHPFVFRTYFYFLLSSIIDRPYVPFPVRNPIFEFLSKHEHAPTSKFDPKIVLNHFDNKISQSLFQETVGSPLPPIPNPSFWEVINMRSNGDKTEIINQINIYRKKAKAYREYIWRWNRAYKEGDKGFFQVEQRNLEQLKLKLIKDIGLPQIVWNRCIIPLKIKFPFIEIGEFKLSLPYPKYNYYSKPEYVFIHDWIKHRR